MAKLERNYVSELTEFLNEFDKQHTEPSTSQQAEIDKHQRIAKLRDTDAGDEQDNNIWQDF